METSGSCPSTSLFGGKVGWNLHDWTASDDRVRGGSSVSHLNLRDDCVVFHGNLDTETLGGAGFASQRTTGDDRHWDLSKFNGIEIICDLNRTDSKKYTLLLKDELLPPSANGREQSTVSWEFDFSKADIERQSWDHAVGSLFISWNAFNPTYRGRPKDDAKPLNIRDIKRFSMMMRSFFDAQKGDFSLGIVSINGASSRDAAQAAAGRESSLSDEGSSTRSINKTAEPVLPRAKRSWWSCILGRS